jgi:hypothetical protein
MSRRLCVFVCLLPLAAQPAAAMVGGAAPAPDGIGRTVTLIVGSRGSFCSGVAVDRDLVLTAAHCVPPGADYKLVVFDAARQPTLKDVARVSTHPDFKLDTLMNHRATADVALIKLAAALPGEFAPASLAGNLPKVAPGDTFIVAGAGLAIRGDGKSGGTVRAASLVATGQPGTLQIRLMDPRTANKQPGLGACTGDSGAPVWREYEGHLVVIGVVSWSTGPNNSDGCGGLTGVTPLVRYRAWLIEAATRLGNSIGSDR